MCVCVCVGSLSVYVCYILDAFEIHLSLIACSNWYESALGAGVGLGEERDLETYIESQSSSVFKSFLYRFSYALQQHRHRRQQCAIVSVSFLVVFLFLEYFCECDYVAYALPKNNERHKRTRSGSAAAAGCDVAVNGCRHRLLSSPLGAVATSSEIDTKIKNKKCNANSIASAKGRGIMHNCLGAWHMVKCVRVCVCVFWQVRPVAVAAYQMCQHFYLWLVNCKEAKELAKRKSDNNRQQQ